MTLRRWALLLPLLGACAVAPGDRLVATLPANADIWWASLSADGSTAAWVERRGSVVFVTVGSRRYGPYT